MFITCPNPRCPSNTDNDSPEVIYVDRSYKFCPGCGKSLSDLKIPVEFLFDQLERAREEQRRLVNIGVKDADAWRMVEEQYPMIKTFQDWKQ